MITTTSKMGPPFQHWTELQNIDEILARSRARYKNSSRSKSAPTKKITSQNNNRSRYIRNRRPKPPPGKTNAEAKHAVQDNVNRSTLSIRNNDPGTYVEHELPATDKHAEFESLKERKTQPGKFSTDLYHITSRDIASRDTGPMLAPEELLSPATEEDLCSLSQSHIRRFRTVNSFLGIDDDIPPSKREKHPQLDTARKASGDCELFYFELEETEHQDTISTAVVELEGSSISNVSDPPEVSADIPAILRPGRPLPLELVDNKTYSHAATVEKAATFPLPNNSPNELFLPCHERSEILWSQPSRQRSNLRGYIASMRERHSVRYKTYKKPESTPSRILEYPEQIILTKPTPTSSPIASPSQFLDQGLLMPPPRLHKKKSRHQKLIADSIYVKELRIRRLSRMSITDEEFAARRDSIMQEVIVILGD